ncbi:hypothetical protein [Streptomyces griseorubiginosus]|uniref:hypothetical protein n=1 Tax=Streptomyces griseorubiginosus TaxID=67304 RepID=UPI001AD7E45C|nr:hypothetical protein [Streptomyces griseorubiginosus]MBO4253873.1 hypothetical protein [Streptomyces griseorubiginosus]
MIVVAVLVVPLLGGLLVLMDRVEDWLAAAPGPPRHAHARRHLKLIPGGLQKSRDVPERESARRETDAA